MPRNVTFSLSHGDAWSAVQWLERQGEVDLSRSERLQEIVTEFWDQASADTNSAIIQACDHAGNDAGADRIDEAVGNAVRNLPRRAINSMDFPLLDDEQLRRRRQDPDRFREFIDELVSDASYRHTGRPGECGGDCPALLDREYRFGDLSDREMRALIAFQETGQPPEPRSP